MSNEYVIGRMKHWARCKRHPPHELGRAAESLEWRMMTGEAFIRSKKKFSGGDGGVSHAVTAHPDALREHRSTAEIDRALHTLRRRDKGMHNVVYHAFATVPGERVTARAGAAKNNLSESEWRRKLNDGLRFIDGALATAA